ncbi:thialysine N-epsilon-acetyltransferase-like isoform X1 [Mercenaria mercenaria]|uniref:thialysine N-epsilon-acetyltransferase-like isoform X1 n=1 Tax=Mercenaria mercenaria TaxID=6596 RepID=UPI00234F983B|nr:thialysine N-epsilon-acetyltransferase-like isoform X1 [Mercenaria mercenaria]
MDNSTISIRDAKPEDCDQIITLIQELANFANMPNGPKLSADVLRKDGFGEEKMFRCLVACDGDCLVAYALYFFNYSTWEGVNLYLEDLYVTPAYRHRGIGTKLWRKVAQVAVDRKCNRLDWVCLGWNKQSIEFYKSKGSVNLTLDEDWNLFRLSGDNLRAFANNSQ